ncbi:hypothetical protein [Rhodococcus sp. H29-C3]|uniref:hypothetical protein n=1 Tax=Rhodococcus sp. H29-C3 TaxID=3046307 RepID=UPI0024BBCE1A|nr:hypothetical protein [Rhodococcus sp. H29-C3]MDJ0362506.1 hypothetical protein [Rhodococcus sp. H29-C3]
MPGWIHRSRLRRRSAHLTAVRRREALAHDTALVDTAAMQHWADRSLHPIIDTDALTWIDDDRLHTTGAAHRFDASVRLRNPDDDETIGDLPESVRARLAAVLAAHTSTPSDAHLLVWEGYGYPWNGSPSSLGFCAVPGDDPGPWPWPALPSFIRHGPTATMDGGRGFVVFTGPVESAARVEWQIRGTWFQHHWPDVAYPDDRAWLAYSDIDEDTLDVHGTAALIQALRDLDGVDIEPL